jgi:hypothetical protein
MQYNTSFMGEITFQNIYKRYWAVVSQISTCCWWQNHERTFTTSPCLVAQVTNKLHELSNNLTINGLPLTEKLNNKLYNLFV